jgi:hypothetical protein
LAVVVPSRLLAPETVTASVSVTIVLVGIAGRSVGGAGLRRFPVGGAALDDGSGELFPAASLGAGRRGVVGELVGADAPAFAVGLEVSGQALPALPVRRLGEDGPDQGPEMIRLSSDGTFAEIGHERNGAFFS